MNVYQLDISKTVIMNISLRQLGRDRKDRSKCGREHFWPGRLK
jgi:hypothetical protein